MSSACCKVLLSNSCSLDECSHNHLLAAANSYVMDVYLMMLLPSGSTSSMMYYVLCIPSFSITHHLLLKTNLHVPVLRTHPVH